MTGGGERLFGRYSIRGRVAVGGMGELFEARLDGPHGFSKPVAIKRILPQHARKESFRRMFLDEGRIMARLGHRNIIQIFELGDVGGQLYMCMELVRGCDLGRLLEAQGEPLGSALAVWIARELCAGLEYLHGATDDDGRLLQLVHRDVNPRNILLSVDGDVKLGDFGIVKSIDVKDRTATGEVKGKLQYLSPEQATGDSVTRASDVYAVGLVLYEMLTGQRYIRGETPAELVKNATTPEWRSPSQHDVEVPAPLLRVLRRALRQRPEERYGTARALGDALGAQLDNLPSAGEEELARLVAQMPAESHDGSWAAPTTWIDRTASTVAEGGRRGAAPPATPEAPPEAAPEVAPGAAPEAPPPPSRRWVAISLGLVGLAVAAGLAVLWTCHSPAPEPRGDVGAPALDVGRDARSEIQRGADLERRKDAARPVRRTVRRANRAPDSRAGPDVQPAWTEEQGVDPDAVLLAAELARLRRSMQREGVREDDIPAVAGLVARARRETGSGDARAARTTLDALRGRIDAADIDRAFIERKLALLRRRLERAGKIGAFRHDVQRILRAVVESRYRDANHAINAILDRVTPGGGGLSRSY